MRKLVRLASDRTGAAAAEMAMVAPLLIIILLSTFEAGHYFMAEHVVQKAVRDASRYAARLSVDNYNCSTNSVGATAVTQIQRVARTGDPDGDWNNDGSTDQRLGWWTSDTMTSVSLACVTGSGTTYVANGLYKNFPNSGAVPVVTVAATVPYKTMFGTLGLAGASNSNCATGQSASWACLRLNARSQAAVFGA